MIRRILSTLSLIFVFNFSSIFGTPALAQEPRMEHRFGPGPAWYQSGTATVRVYKRSARRGRVARHSAPRYTRREATVIQHGPPPGCPARAWCGCWLAQHLGIKDRSLWLAREWARIGSAASGPAPGVIAVWPHHVGIVRQVTGPGRAVVLSGNDSRAVRERERSLRGVIAWRRVGARYASR